MEMTINEFTFVLPKSADELMEEGKALKHCVGGLTYINDHAEGKTTIVFVRNNEKINDSFFTIEYREERVIQLQGTKNKAPIPDELKKAVNEWKERVNQLDLKGEPQVA